MTVQEYRDRLFMALSAFERSEVENVVDYYTELIEDADDPEQQMNSLGTPEQLATRIIQENGWVRPDEQFSGSQGQGSYAPPPKKSGWSAGRIVALVLTFPFWIAGFAVIVSLFFVIMSIYLAVASASIAGFAGAVSYIKSFIPFSAELAFVGLMLAGLAILLFHPAKALFRGVAGLVADYSYFLFAPGKYRNRKNTPHRPISKLAAIVGAVMLVVGIGGTFYCEDRISKSALAYIRSMDLESFETELDTADNISVSVNSGNISVLPSTDGRSKLVCENVRRSNLKIESDKRLKITYSAPKESRSLPKFDFKLDNNDINIGSINRFQEKTQAHLTLYLPQEQLEKLKIHTDLGDLTVTSVNSDALNLDSSCGNIKLSGSSAKSFVLTNDLGETNVENCNFDEAEITANCGEVNFSETECTGRLTVEENLGDIKASDCTFGSVSINNDCGDINFTNTVIKSDSDMTDDLGDIDLELVGSDYAVNGSTDLGDVKINGEEKSTSEGRITLTLKCSAGDIDVDYQ